MEKTGNRGRMNQSLHRFHQRHSELIGLVGNGFGIAAGIAWLLGFLPAAPVWAWPATASLAVLAAVIALYRAQEIEISRRELQEANRILFTLASKQIISGVEQFARDAEARQQLPITEMAGMLQTLRMIQPLIHTGADEELDQALAALAQYERQATGQRQH